MISSEWGTPLKVAATVGRSYISGVPVTFFDATDFFRNLPKTRSLLLQRWWCHLIMYELCKGSVETYQVLCELFMLRGKHPNGVTQGLANY